jgi:hypothetical protein
VTSSVRGANATVGADARPLARESKRHAVRDGKLGSMHSTLPDLRDVLRDTVREAARSWRLPAALALGVGFGFIERNHTGETVSFVFGPAAALYTLFLGPLPWRVLVPLEADGDRVRKLGRWLLAATIGLAMFAVLVALYGGLGHTLDLRTDYLLTHPRELAVSTLLFLVGGWGLARDVQLEQRLDRTIRTHGKLAAELEEARLNAVRADLDPHFLFNALNAIASQCVSNPRQAEENVVRLSSLLRAVLDTRRRPLHSLDDELALARDYLGLLGARYPQLAHSIDVADGLGAVLVPPLLLQPLLENAVRHGDIAKGAIEVRGAREISGRIRLEVRSPGLFRGGRDGGMGVELVQRRVALAWGDAGRFTIGSDGEQTAARIEIPAMTSPPTPARSAA